jgi:hypothetical protein
MSIDKIIACLFVAVASLAAAACGSKQAPPENGGGGGGDGVVAECPADQCGPEMGMPNRTCPDGETVGGPTGRCLKQGDGSCGWEVIQCPGDGQGEAACVKGGCSGTLCLEEGNDRMTTCEFKPEYACYQTATCERQEGGACGWTETQALTECLAAGGPADAE